jgi:sulfoxide reductase heme-binding subunit YedZ
MRAYKWIFVFLLLGPVYWLVWLMFHGSLGAQPAEKINHELGRWTYYYLAANLIWGRLLVLNWVPAKLRRFTLLRRHLGVVTFIFALSHMIFYLLKEGDIALAFEQIPTKLYLAIGMTSLLILFALALTSNNWGVRKLKRNWKRLHRLAYLALGLATVHYFLIEKKDWRVTLPWLIAWLLLAVIAQVKAISAASNKKTTTG